MKKPVLLLDVDGVLAPFGGQPPEGFYLLPVKEIHIHWHDGTSTHLQRLQQTLELQWATGWEASANEDLLHHLGLEDPLPHIAFDHKLEREGGPKIDGAWVRRSRGLTLREDVATWKLPWIRQWATINEDRPFAWIDDEMFEDAEAFAKERTEGGIPTLFIKPDPSVGMTHDHVAQIEDWARGIPDA